MTSATSKFPPKPGDFGLVSTHGPGALAIRAGENIYQRRHHLKTVTKNHAFIYMGDGTIVEANPTGANYGSVLQYENIMWSTGWWPLTVQQRHDITMQADRFVAAKTPYNWLDIAALTVSLTLDDHAVPKFVWGRLDRPDRLICSQLVAACYADAGIHLDVSDTGQITPGMLESWIRVRSGEDMTAGR